MWLNCGPLAVFLRSRCGLHDVNMRSECGQTAVLEVLEVFQVLEVKKDVEKRKPWNPIFKVYVGNQFIRSSLCRFAT
jgi:glutaredoxin-related protein